MPAGNHLYRKLWSLATVLVLLPSGIFCQAAPQGRDRPQAPRSQQSESSSTSRRSNERGPRAVAVIEWHADARGRATPKLVPVVIVDGGRMYDAGMYRATPVPMALEPGTVYEAQDAGEILGYFTVKGAARANRQAAADVDSDSTAAERPWIGLGDWKTASPQLDAYGNRPQHAEIVRPSLGTINGPIVDERDSADDRSSTKQRTTVYNEEGKEEPRGAEDRPTLKRGGSNKREKEGTPRVAPQSSTTSKTSDSGDADRPRLKRQGADAGQASAAPAAQPGP